MDTLIPRLPVTKALHTMLDTGFGGGKPVGLGVHPKVEGDEGEVPAEPPYGILYPMWTSRSGSPFSQPDEDAVFVYQLALRAKDTKQLEWMYDKANELLFERNSDGSFVTALLVDGLAVIDRRPADESGGDPGRDSGTATLSYDIRFAIAVTRGTP